MTTMALEDPVDLARTLGRRLDMTRRPGDDVAFAQAIVARMREDRLLWAPAPRERGGSGLSIGGSARVTYHVGRLSGSAGLIYAMHLSQALSLIRHDGPGPYLAGLVDRLVRDQSLVASGTSEKGVGGDILTSRCAIEEAGDGALRLRKESPNISYLDEAGAILITAMRPRPDGKPTQVLVAADMRKVAVQPGRLAAFMGMRGICNRPYALTATFEAGAVFRDSYPVIARETMTPAIHIFWAALWSGLAAQILGKARLFLAREAAEVSTATEAMRFAFSRLVDRHHAMNALIRDAIADAERCPSQDGAPLALAQTARVKRLKVTCSELLAEICEGGRDLVGLRGYAEDGPYSLSEPLRDAMSARIMVSNYRIRAGNAQIERYIDEEL